MAGGRSGRLACRDVLNESFARAGRNLGVPDDFAHVPDRDDAVPDPQQGDTDEGKPEPPQPSLAEPVIFPASEAITRYTLDSVG
jgi:hypothetical protein